MKKSKFICQQCGYESSGWLGKCPACNSWNSFVEETIKPKERRWAKHKATRKPVSITSVSYEKEAKAKSGIIEFDRVLGGGVVKGSLVLIGGEPGIGKSTLILQTADKLTAKGLKTLYVTGEESVEQTKLRAKRIKAESPDLFILAESNLESIKESIDTVKPEVLVIDSIQTTYHPELSSPPGSVGQVRESGSFLLNIAKSENIATFLVGHVTKEGTVAGPKTLEHMVDTVLYLEGDRHHHYRILRAVKNRFGSTNEIGIFEMKECGLVEVANPSAIFLQERLQDAPGSVVVAIVEGTRPLLAEIQALVSPSVYGVPQRVATGVDYKRLSLLLAVIEKRIGLRLTGQDVFVNVAGGIKIDEPAIDLGEVTAIVSNFKNRAVNPSSVVIGEVGLSGEVRAVSQIEKRIKEAEKLGFKRCVISHNNLKGLSKNFKIKIDGVADIKEALNILL